MNRLQYTVILLFLSFSALAQQEVFSLEDCYRLARENYPLIQKQDLIRKTEQYSLENASKLYLPQLSFIGQASYQSETVRFPAGTQGASFHELSKDQYKIAGEVSQTVFDGGLSRNLKASARLAAETEQQALEVNLYALKERITQIYFAVLLMDEQLKQHQLKKDNLQRAFGKIKAACQNGTAYKSNAVELEAELINADAAEIELRSNQEVFLKQLSLFTGKEIAGSSQLIIPAEKQADFKISRPELRLFDAKADMIILRKKQLKTDYLPKVNAFFQGSYGRPTLNFLEDEFGFWYIGGLRLNWNLGSLYTLSNRKRLLEIERRSLEAEKETFLLNTRQNLIHQDKEIEKYRRLIEKDEAVIELRASVKKSAEAQLDNGVITVRDYIGYVNAEDLARQHLILHKIQMLQAQCQFNNISGGN